MSRESWTVFAFRCNGGANDACPQLSPTTEANWDVARRLAETEGWSLAAQPGEGDYCPEHVASDERAAALLMSTPGYATGWIAARERIMDPDAALAELDQAGFEVSVDYRQAFRAGHAARLADDD